MPVQVKTASADFKVSETGQLQTPKGGAIETVEHLEQQELDSRLPDAVWKTIKYLEFTSPAGGYMHLFVQATVRLAPLSGLPHTHRLAPMLVVTLSRTCPCASVWCARSCHTRLWWGHGRSCA